MEQLYLDNMYEVRLDIASFFDSIYTHSIPWAIHTKKMAKKDKSESLFGNILDNCMQNLNYGQTNGILVGNAVSRIISEIILCTVDKEIQNAFPKLNYKRYVDDYYIYVKNEFEINQVVSVIRQVLSKYELTLNENKIEVFKSPFTYGKPWVEQMKGFLHLKSDIFLKKTIMEYNNNKDIQIIKYGLKVIRYQKFSKDEWRLLESTLINLWVRFPSLSYIFVVIFKVNEEHLRVSLLKKAIYSIVDNNLPFRNDQEVIWAIWTVKIFNIDISKGYITNIIQSKNWLAIIIMLDIIKTKKLKQKKSILKLLEELYDEIFIEYLNEDANDPEFMWSDIWLLAYEADKNKWLNISQEKRFLFARKNQFFKELRTLGIDFYNGSYQYNILEPISKKSLYITRAEFGSILEKLQKSFKAKNNSGEIDNGLELTKEEEALLEELHEAANESDY
ncbi:RNA-directed DNA polymerase [Anaerovorax odorimutans]|uniref:RNA-directed DNA polymerase n=1 Tax=Anaerovorax odorimutans TaxID=109327 RepID=UPI00041F19F7|nr:RNA-directed DNA polymerase [Anaerovorax odorimutans]